MTVTVQNLLQYLALPLSPAFLVPNPKYKIKPEFCTVAWNPSESSHWLLQGPQSHTLSPQAFGPRASVWNTPLAIHPPGLGPISLQRGCPGMPNLSLSVLCFLPS